MSRYRHTHDQYMKLSEIEDAIGALREARKYVSYNWEGAEDHIAEAETILRGVRRWFNRSMPQLQKPSAPLANINLQSWKI